MTEKQKRVADLQRRQSEIVTRMQELDGLDSMTDEQQQESDRLGGEYRENGVRLRAALTLAGEEVEETETETGQDAEARERAELRGRVRLGRYVGAAMHNRPPDGAEAEYAAACGAAAGHVPFEFFEADQLRERAAAPSGARERAVTPAPANVGRNLAGITPALFDRSAAAWLGIDMPSVGVGDAGYPVLSTSVTGGPQARGAVAAETVGAFTVAVAQPRRVTAALRFNYEDSARLDGMESALRMNLEMVVSDATDDQAINGSGSGDGTINGLRAILTDAPAPAAGVETFARYVAAAAGHVDGLFAVDLMGVRSLVGVNTYGHMAGTFRSAEDSMTAEGWAMDRTGGLRTSRRIPAPVPDDNNSPNANLVQEAIIRRTNPAGDSVAVMPVWSGGLQLIRDEYSGAAKGEIVITALVLVGDVVLLRPDAFRLDSYRLVA